VPEAFLLIALIHSFVNDFTGFLLDTSERAEETRQDPGPREAHMPAGRRMGAGISAQGRQGSPAVRGTGFGVGRIRLLSQLSAVY